MASYPQDFPFGIMDVAELMHLKIRRRQANSVYVDCPFCGDRRGKMNVNFVKNVWRCNYCDEHGGMLALYAKLNHTTNSDAYREICEALQTGDASWVYTASEKQDSGSGEDIFSGAGNSGGGNMMEGVPQSPRASIQEIHQTLSLMMGMLSLKPAHRAHLRSPKRGLTDDQIDSLGFKSTPPPFMCRSITERLIRQGCTVQGVPGFYLDDSGKWTVKFYSKTSGILIPAVGVDGLIHGAQILLDVPIKDKDDPPDKPGTKYIWFSSSNRNMGVTSGSPVHFVGNSFARTIYVTEGLLKADIAHSLMNRSFVATAGAGNVAQLEPMFALLASNGTELIIEADDMDKYSNKMTSKGASKVYLMAKKYGMDCRRLTWNPNYKGVDDWQLSLRLKEEPQIEEQTGCFKQDYLSGLCSFEDINRYVEMWKSSHENSISLQVCLGFTEQEYQAWQEDQSGGQLNKLLTRQRRRQQFRLYQLEFGDKPFIPFAFKGIDELHKAGYEQPPAADYCLVCESEIICPAEKTELEILGQIFQRFNHWKPEGYNGRVPSPSDVIELYGKEGRKYYYCDIKGFVPVRFSPFFCKRTKIGLEQKETDSIPDR